MAFETFSRPGSYDKGRMLSHEPSCFNGIVEVRRYRVTFEEIPEPVEVLGARLQKLWEETDNHHHWTPLRHAAAAIGYELKGQQGVRRRTR